MTYTENNINSLIKNINSNNAKKRSFSGFAGIKRNGLTRSIGKAAKQANILYNNAKTSSAQHGALGTIKDIMTSGAETQKASVTGQLNLSQMLYHGTVAGIATVGLGLMPPSQEAQDALALPLPEGTIQLTDYSKVDAMSPVYGKVKGIFETMQTNSLNTLAGGEKENKAKQEREHIDNIMNNFNKVIDNKRIEIQNSPEYKKELAAQKKQEIIDQQIENISDMTGKSVDEFMKEINALDGTSVSSKIITDLNKDVKEQNPELQAVFSQYLEDNDIKYDDTVDTVDKDKIHRQFANLMQALDTSKNTYNVKYDAIAKELAQDDDEYENKALTKLFENDKFKDLLATDDEDIINKIAEELAAAADDDDAETIKEKLTEFKTKLKEKGLNPAHAKTFAPTDPLDNDSSTDS